MASSKWERCVIIGVIFAVLAFIMSLLGDDFTSLVGLFGFVSAIFIIFGMLIFSKFIKKKPFYGLAIFL